MTVETQFKNIDGLEFEITQLGFRDQRRAFIRLTKTIGPGLAQLLSSVSTGDGFNSALAVRGIAELTASLEEEDLDYLSELFGKNCKIHSEGKVFIFHADKQRTFFKGKLMTSFKWLAACVEVNFSDFLGEFRGLVGGAQTEEAATEK